MKTLSETKLNRLISVFLKRNALQIKAFILLKNHHIRRGGPGLNISLTTDEQLKC